VKDYNFQNELVDLGSTKNEPHNRKCTTEQYCIYSS